MKLIVGLGNPGEKYESTRHNLGFMVLDHFLKEITPSKVTWSKDEKLKSEIYLFDYKPKEGKEEKLILVRPQTHMNNSGMAISLVSKYYKVSPIDIWIVHDELDINFGVVKYRLGGSARGHNGLKSFIEKWGDNFSRLRVGIGRPANKEDVPDYVLHKFTEPADQVKDLISLAAEKALQLF